MINEIKEIKKFYETSTNNKKYKKSNDGIDIINIFLNCAVSKIEKFIKVHAKSVGKRWIICGTIKNIWKI